jgi:1-deoxy-D-xylulose 5-phosphate reductoisomerase
MKPKNIVLLGCTGSIGVSTQKVVADLPDQFRIVGMASRENVDGMETGDSPVQAAGRRDDEP